MFRLTAAEKSEVVAKCDHLARLKFSPSLPNAFSEHGAIMVASVLNSPQFVLPQLVSTFPSRPQWKLDRQ